MNLRDTQDEMNAMYINNKEIPHLLDVIGMDEYFSEDNETIFCMREQLVAEWMTK